MEEGEIIDDDDDLYTPLQRPVEPESSHRAAILDESEPSEEETDSDDSDAPNRAPKKQKLKPSAVNQSQGLNSKKYNIWASGIQEEVLTQELTNCEVNQRFERNRDVESYDYTLFKEESGADSRVHNNKRQFDDRRGGGVKARLGRRRSSGDSAKGVPRTMLDLTVTKDSTDQEVSNDIANKLCEEKEELILRVVEVLGKAKAIEIFELTQKIEEGGGMLIMNQTRRRTPGGVFLFHVKSSCNQEENQKIFIDDRRQIDAQRRVERSKRRRERAKQMHRRLEEGNLLEMPNSPRPDALSGEDEESARNVSNPPPSPVTDGRAESSPEACPESQRLATATALHPERTLTTYDDFLDLNEGDNMDVF